MDSFKFLINVGEVTSGGVLASVLAPLHIDLVIFSRMVNEKSLFLFVKSVPVSLKVKVINNRVSSFTIGGPSFNFYLSSFVDLMNLSILEFFNLVVLYSRDNSLGVLQSSLILFGTLSSFNNRVKFVFDF